LERVCMRKFLRGQIKNHIQARGYSSYFAYEVFKVRFDDFFTNKSTTLRQKIWAQRRGFLSDKILIYGLTDENYRNYLSDFDYYRLHPINGIFGHWIDDKLTTKLVLHPFSEYLPEYYFHLYNGKILRLADCPAGYDQTVQGLVNLLKEKNHLAAKLYSATQSEGFYKLSYTNNQFFVNNILHDEKEVCDLISKWLKMGSGGYLITEYLFANQELSKIWGESPNTLRIMVINEDNQCPKIASAFFRFGTKKTGVIDNPQVGGVICAVDINTGFFNQGSRYQGDFLIECLHHPDTNVLMEGITPHWDLISRKLIEISIYIPQVNYLGFDLIVTDKGFKVIEINSHQALRSLQHYQPLLNYDLTRDFFQNLIDKKM
jgi:hypothetical protein